MNEFTPQDISRLLQLDSADLYLLLLNEQAEKQLYSKEGRIAQGQNVFATRFRRVRDELCSQYRARGTKIDNLIDLTALIATVLLASQKIEDTFILPMAALISKIGLQELCPEEEKD